jgi:hypothetical protein
MGAVADMASSRPSLSGHHPVDVNRCDPQPATTYGDGSHAGWTKVKDRSWYDREAWRFDRRWTSNS